jgi:hypothetical protein
MAERKLNHFSDLGHLLAAATNVIISNFVKVVLLLVSLDGLALAVDDGILCDDTELWRVDLDNLELHLSHATTDNEKVALADWSVSFPEVGSEENIEERAGDTLDGIGNGENRNSLGVFDIGARVDGDHVTVLDPQVMAHDSVDASAAIIELIIGEDNEDGVLSLLASDKNGVTSEELERVHGGLGEGNDAVVIVDGIGDHQLVGLLLLLEDRGRGVIFVLDLRAGGIGQVDLLVVVLVRLGSHDDCLDASGEAAAGSLDDERRGSWKCCGESQSMAVASETER